MLEVLKVWEILEVPRLYTEDDILLLCTEERLCSLHRGESLYRGESVVCLYLSVQRRGCVSRVLVE